VRRPPRGTRHRLDPRSKLAAAPTASSRSRPVASSMPPHACPSIPSIPSAASGGSADRVTALVIADDPPRLARPGRYVARRLTAMTALTPARTLRRNFDFLDRAEKKREREREREKEDDQEA